MRNCTCRDKIVTVREYSDRETDQGGGENRRTSQGEEPTQSGSRREGVEESDPHPTGRQDHTDPDCLQDQTP